MSDALVGRTAKLSIGDGSSPDVFTQAAEITSISGPARSAQSVDVTHLNSPNDYMEYKPGMLDAGEVTIEGRWIPTNATLNTDADGLLNLFEARTTRTFKIDWPDGSDTQFEAFITSFEPNVGGHSEPVNLSVGLKCTGKPTETQSA